MKSVKEPKVKLTLTVKKSAIDEAKKYASQAGTSLSNIVEDYLVNYSKNKQEPKSDTRDFKQSLAYQLMGFAKDGPISSMTDDEIKNLRIKERFNL
ncbi:DUF6364 family protein [Dyadobacter diqingensis]|uniref:DUF6364 family protein n=1 Tax=Dyadobacter diqingensis TaxID=2938121 RepID=UPI0020C39617|nr:DUF6364 family protein [Dyadobacter diqingensis]